jgi:TP901 family phage tail tape measure protein
MLILRARDEATRVLRGAAGNINDMSSASKKAAQAHIDQGKSLVTVGAGIAYAGALGVKWLVDSTNAAGDYNTQVAYTKTQTDKVQVSLKELSKIGLDLAKTIPVPFEEIQGGLYDIFSSMDVTVPQAQNLLTEFSKAAVAGQTDLQTAGKGTIAILNAWKLPATEVNRVNDVMFRLVQKGVGTYTQFSSAIGRAIPSTVRAGNSIEDLAGMMAFMTRNGLSTAQAATSAGRAFDAMSNPATEEHMKDIGLSVRNAKGEFKPMAQVVEELNGKLKNMTAPERADALKKLFLGSGGTIQARRFFDLAIPGFKELNLRTKEMHDSAGTMEGAYKTMFDTPQAQMQLMTNKYQAMRVEVGDRLLPIKMKLVEIIMKVLDAWDRLSPGTQKFIVIAAAVASVLTVLVGILVIVAGGILMIMGAAALAGVALSTVAVVIGVVIAVIVAIIAVAWLLYDNWDAIMSWFREQWDLFLKDIQRWKDGIVNAWKGFIQFWKDVWEGVKIVSKQVWTAILEWLSNVGTNAVNKLKAIWTPISNFFKTLWLAVKSATMTVWNAIINFFQLLPGRTYNAVVSIKNRLTSFFSSVGTAVKNTVVSKFTSVVNWFKTLPGKIRGAIPSPGSMLNGIGRSIVQGLINGVSSMIGSLKNKFSQITNLIPSWKGPANVDKKLLYGAGQLTMQGYGEGIEDGAGAIKTKLGGMTKRIPSWVPGQGEGNGGGGEVTQNFYITTQEIDPKKHAADLGFLLASKVG